MSKNLDGWRKNYSKFLVDYRKLQQVPDGAPKDWLKKPWDLHAYVDMFVEADRVAPYLMGHIWAVVFPITIFLIFI